MNSGDRKVLRPLAERYSEIAHLDVQKKRIERYYRTNACEEVRPVLLIDEVPWGEIRDDCLRNVCSKECAWLEGLLRTTLYKWDHFQVDMVIEPVFHIPKRLSSSGIGLEVKETQIKGDTGAYIAAHEYKDQLATEADLAKLQTPKFKHEKDTTERAVNLAKEVFDGLMPVETSGTAFHYSLWDTIARYRGVENLLMDLAMRPEFMHKTVARFTEIAEATIRQLGELDVLDSHQLTLHCTVGCARDLPAKDFAGKTRPKDVWGRCAAQIFGSVSPEMHDEFDLAYNERIFRDCGLVYYGCCEPMDSKIGILRKRFKNLRKVSITPWADPERAAQAMGRDLVMAAKPNPAFVSSATFNPAPVEEEMTRYIEACRRHGTTCEFVLKDISTIANNPSNLTLWAETATRVIDRYYGRET
jgi:hypothetical protein